MRCFECGADFDEMNESQPVCPGCGTVPEGHDVDVGLDALLDGAAKIGTDALDQVEDSGPDLDQATDPIRLPIDLQEARDDAEALLLATGYAAFDLPGRFRVFKLPTDLVM